MLKNKIIVRKIRNILILLMAIIIMFGAYKNIDRSKAEEVIEIYVTAVDNYGYLEDEEVVLEAKQIEDDLYEILLPENVNSKKINKIINVTLEDLNVTENEESIALEIIENKIEVTKEQLENLQINLEVAYDVAILEKNEDGTYQKNLLSEKSEEERQQIEVTEETEMLYSKILRYEDEANGKLVELKGFLPKDAELQVEEVSQEQLKEIFGDKEVSVAYDIKIIRRVITQVPTDEADPTSEPEEIVEIIELNPEDFGETCEVSIKDVNIEENSEVYHVKEDNTIEQVNVKDNTQENISFEAQTFSIYAVTTAATTTATTGISLSFSGSGTKYVGDTVYVSVSGDGELSSAGLSNSPSLSPVFNVAGKSARIYFN